jgi:hypothetical protein
MIFANIPFFRVFEFSNGDTQTNRRDDKASVDDVTLLLNYKEVPAALVQDFVFIIIESVSLFWISSFLF